MDLDDTNHEISIESSSNLSREQTPVAGASYRMTLEDLNEMTPEDLNSLKKQVCEYARKDKWKEAESIFNKYADIVRIPLTDNEDTALHVAVSYNSITFVKGLLNLMTPQDLEIRNLLQQTAFLMAAEAGNSDLVQIMIVKNENLSLIKFTPNGMLPVHWAAIGGHHKMVQDLSSKTLLEKMDSEDIRELFFRTIEHDMFDVATKLFEEYPDVLAIAKYGILNETALEMLLRKPSKELNECLRTMKKNCIYAKVLFMERIWNGTKEGNNRGASSGESLQLLQKLWLQLETQLGQPEIYDWIGSHSSVLVDALESGNVEALKWLLKKDKKLRELPVNSNQQNILHYAVRKRHSSFVNYIFKSRIFFYSQLEAVDKDDNNILHLAAYPLEIEESSSTLRPTTRMKRDVEWFKQVKKNAPSELSTMRNKEEKTPTDVFKVEHMELSQEVKDAAKVIAECGMVVAALVAAVAFAAALTVPGDETNPWFTAFILANAAALFTSSASIFFSLSNFTTLKFADKEFVIALHPSLILERMLLHISIVTLIISFVAASFLIFEHRSKWVAYVVTSMGVLTILLSLLFKSSIFDTFLWSRFYHL